ncbi:MAG: hypothetical protein HYZ75_00330 [Elusimicrobia bacterium]|nr:hypothetical protein [Elusimicrobiota bacterium]
MSDTSTEKDEEKKGAGVPAWMTGTARVGSGAGGGSSAAGGGLARFLALATAPKAIVALTVAGGLAVGMGIVNSIADPKEPSLGQRFHKERVRTDGRSDLPGMERPGESALNMAQKANTGFYTDPNASAPPPDSESPAVDAPADPALPEGAAQGAAVDPAGAAEQMAAALGGQQSSKAGGKFGKLSSSVGGARGVMAGGAGLAGGIGGSFKQNLSNSRSGDLRGFAGANRAQATRGKLSARNLGKSSLKGATAKRLDKMNRAMGKVGATSADAAAATHTRQWESASPTGAGISGAGASGGATAGGQFSEEEGVGGGGPLDQNTSSPSSAAPVADVNGSNQTQYQSQMTMAKGLLMMASAIITIIGIISIIRDGMSATVFGAGVAAGLLALQKVMLLAAMGMASAAAVIGATIGSKYGQGQQGAIVALGGTITAVAAGAAMVAPKMPAWLLVLGGIVGLAAPLMGGGGKTADRSDISANG